MRQCKIQQRWIAKLVAQQLLQPLQQHGATCRKNGRIVSVPDGIADRLLGEADRWLDKAVSSPQVNIEISVVRSLCERSIFAEAFRLLSVLSQEIPPR